MTVARRSRTSTELWTIGHSTRACEDFIALLQAHHIHLVADVRLIPYSRRNPQFNAEPLALSLERAGIGYLACGGLGGRRKATPHSSNLGWRNASFRGYADYMQTPSFGKALGLLMERAGTTRTAIMCAEAVPWRCHRSLIADALVSHGWTVRHILAPDRADPHRLPPFAVIREGMVTYPADK
jgi:uncharacterized protein (DUF488 family)